MTQPTLFETVTTPYGASYGQHAAVTAPEHVEDIDRRFDAWLRANPHVLEEFCRRAFAFKQAGYRTIRGKRIIEEMRDDYKAQTTGDKHKLNNSWTSRLVRVATTKHPELADFFEQRELRS